MANSEQINPTTNAHACSHSHTKKRREGGRGEGEVRGGGLWGGGRAKESVHVRQRESWARAREKREQLFHQATIWSIKPQILNPSIKP